MKKTNISRILVALDTSTVNRSIFQTATMLAASLDAKLKALLIEDINLFQFAELPIAREIVYGSGTGRGVNITSMERSVRLQTDHLCKMVQTIAQHSKMNIALDVKRGDIASTIYHASKQTDLLIIGRNTRLLKQNLSIDTKTQTVLSANYCNLMVLQQGAIIERPVVVIFDGSEASLNAISFAGRLARQNHHTIIVFFPKIDEHQYQQLYQRLIDKLDEPTLQVHPVRLTSNSTAQILQHIKQYRGCMLVLGKNCSLLNDGKTQELIMQTNIPVVLLR